jgi:preprotein translocase subunit SecY
VKKFIETLKNIWSIEELRKRILFTLTLVLIYRVGCYITIPGINPVILDSKSGGGPDGLKEKGGERKMSIKTKG